MRHPSTFAALALVVSLPSVTAHGRVEGIVHLKDYFRGWNFWSLTQSIQWANDNDQWFEPVYPHHYQTDDIICHLKSVNAPIHLTVAAGDLVTMQWSNWLVDHQGPVLDYLANCHGACETVNKNDLEFFKIGASGLLTSKGTGEWGPRGTWASDQLRENNNTWLMRIPPTLAPGNYVHRHEIISLHNSYELDGAQHFISCINLEVTGSGTENPSGVPAKQFYKSDDHNIHFTIWADHSTYDLPGPTLWSGAVPPIQTGAFQMPDGDPVPNPPGFNGGGSPNSNTGAKTTASSSGATATSSGGASSTTLAPIATTAPSGPDMNMSMSMDMGPTGPTGGNGVNKALDSTTTSKPSTTVAAVSVGATTVSTSTRRKCTKKHPTTTPMAGMKRRHAREVVHK